MQVLLKGRSLRHVLSTLKLPPTTIACNQQTFEAQQRLEEATLRTSSTACSEAGTLDEDTWHREYRAVALPFDSAGAGPLSYSLAWLQRRTFSASSISAADAEASSAAELNPLLQTPAPTGADEAGQSLQGTLSAAGPGRARAVLRGIRMSPKKMAHFAPLIRRMHVEDALAQCRLTTKKAGRICEGVILSAVANAENNHSLNRNRLCVDIVNVGKGIYLRRMSIHGRGRSGVRHRYRCHLEVILKEGNMPQKMQYRKPLLERPRKHFG